MIYLIKDKVANLALWDPLVDENELLELKKQGVKIYSNKPNKIEFAFLCVNHEEIKSYLKSYTGVIFDYRNIEFN